MRTPSAQCAGLHVRPVGAGDGLEADHRRRGLLLVAAVVVFGVNRGVSSGSESRPDSRLLHNRCSYRKALTTDRTVHMKTLIYKGEGRYYM